jgi:hypothetical protein
MKRKAQRRRPQIKVMKRARRAQGEFAKLTQKRWAEADRLKKFYDWWPVIFASLICIAIWTYVLLR